MKSFIVACWTAIAAALLFLWRRPKYAPRGHKWFDLAFREYETQNIGRFQHLPNMIGTCGGVAGPSGSLVRFGMINAEADAFIKQYGMRGAIALVHPAPYGSSNVQGRRIVGSPVFQLDVTDSFHWRWNAVSGSEAVEGDVVFGGLHQVAVYSGVTFPPSDPTIEQFNPVAGPVKLFLIETYQ